MNLIEIFSIIIIHWFSDFLMQDEKWALGKSKNWDDLMRHVTTYSACWFIAGILLKLFIPIFDFNISLFVAITLVCHTITDYFTSRIVSKKFTKGEYGSAIPNTGAFTIIATDQVLHYIQLFTTYWLLTK